MDERREKDTVLLRIEGTYSQKTDWLPEPTVRESPSLPSGGKKHCYDQDGFLFSSACSVFAFSVFHGCYFFLQFLFSLPTF